MSEDPHDWWNAICKRCGTSGTAYSNGEAPTCREESRVVSQHAADDFATIAQRMKEIGAERSALADESGEWTPASGFSLEIIELLVEANEMFKNMVWTEPFMVLETDGGE